MYKAVLVHEIVPGKLSEFERWFQDEDRKRKADDSDYVPFKRYITVIGSVTRLYAEFEMETVPAHPSVWAKYVEQHGDFKDLIVAGKGELYVLEELESEE